MQGKDKISQLKDSIQARKDAEAKQQAAKNAELSPGLESQYQEKIAELEESLSTVLSETDALKEKAAEAHDNFLRKHAEFENFRKRMEKEKADVGKYGHEKMAVELLPVLDSLEKALEHADESTDLQDLISGVQLVLKQFLQALEKFGISPISSVGKSFDPNVHEAVGHIESSQHAPDSVIEEYRRGYLLHDRLLRAAMVSVAKSPQGDDG